MQQLADPLKDAFQSGEQSALARSPEAVSERQLLTVEDARRHGGQIRVSFAARSVAAIRGIARIIMNAGFALHLGNTYVK